MPVIDAHSHIYPDKIACKASSAVGDFYGVDMNAKNASASSMLAACEGSPITHHLVHSVATTPGQVPIINDLAGGVTLTMMDDLTSVDPALVQDEEVTLQGQQALLYVRSRGGLEDSTNLHRMERQRQYMLTLWGQVRDRATSDENFLAKVLLETSAYLVTDCSTDKLSELFEEVGQLEITDILTLDGKSVQGDPYMEYYVDEDMVQETVLQLFYDRVAEG